MARKILLADDSVTAQNMGRKILTDAGYEVITVNNGSSALKKITDIRPDVVVLDVYMPGYSGLEVCQRVKEARETAQIPVLLTVGKLEPFKQDEARRAHADAFIIKPFEATELLAAVAKLHDKLTAAPAPSTKEGRIAAATMASFEKVMSEGAPRFGDQESGWKARLTIPASGPKLPDLEPETPTGNTSAFRDMSEERTPEHTSQSAKFERPTPGGIPQDITPDEIAAITAAAARVNVGLSVGNDFERFRKDSRPADSSPVKTPEKLSEPQLDKPEANLERQAEATAEHKAKFEAKEQGAPSSEGADAGGAAGSATIPVSEAAGKESSALPAAEMVAEPATMAVAAAAGGGNQRWIAEEVPLNAEEAVIVLEREMHKAFAAFAAAEYSAIPSDERGAIDKNDEPMFATMAPPAIGAPVPFAEGNEAAEMEKPMEAVAAATEAAALEQAKRQEFAKPPAAPFAAAASIKVDEEHHSVAAFGAPTPFGEAQGPAETPEAEASATPTNTVSDVVEAAPAATSSNQEPVSAFSPAGSEDTCETEVVQAGSTESDALQQLEELKAAKGLAGKQAAMAAAASGDGTSTELSSIVDSMLAELKPKLMAELAKKLEHKKE